jgi:hypothetical protein
MFGEDMIKSAASEVETVPTEAGLVNVIETKHFAGWMTGVMMTAAESEAILQDIAAIPQTVELHWAAKLRPANTQYNGNITTITTTSANHHHHQHHHNHHHHHHHHSEHIKITLKNNFTRHSKHRHRIARCRQNGIRWIDHRRRILNFKRHTRYDIKFRGVRSAEKKLSEIVLHTHLRGHEHHVRRTQFHQNVTKSWIYADFNYDGW